MSPRPHAVGSVRVDLEFQPSATLVRVPFGVTLFDATSWGEKPTGYSDAPLSLKP
jgi:hypothetical protein